jgi:hypothetical protein
VRSLQQPNRYSFFSASSIDRLNLSVPNRNWQPGQQLPGFLNQLAVLLIFTPHLGQVTSIALSSIIQSSVTRLNSPAQRVFHTSASPRPKGSFDRMAGKKVVF